MSEKRSDGYDKWDPRYSRPGYIQQRMDEINKEYLFKPGEVPDHINRELEDMRAFIKAHPRSIKDLKEIYQRSYAEDYQRDATSNHWPFVGEDGSPDE